MPIKKTVAAAVAAAVNAYIQDDEAALAMMSLQQQQIPHPPVQSFSPWTMAGRAASMDLRRAWQLRLAR
ncbi:hypothetical protein [Desulforhabdus sp. TSK]|uniref:hypothetical protein n=1 Tax=Desulforhabdus sp. TSK TaxID=2925014 RepID=UPI001FC8101B|nr:hypothetical protein [Desulforhabdus sp. TSK]GKT06757.1 hypothetical protein DSTSK_00620 [Desulforhabdus sp. TSK]